MTRRTLSPLAAAAIATLLGCGDGPARPRSPGAGVAVRVEIRPAAVTLESIDDTVRLTAIVRDADGRAVPDVRPVWQLDSARVASLVDGLLIARAAGTATAVVWVSAPATGRLLRDSIRVTVAPRARSWAVVPGVDTVGVGGQLTLELRGLDARGTPVGAAPAVVWRSADDGVATVTANVDATGRLTGRALGVVTVSGTGAAGSASARVTVVAPSAVRVSAGPLNGCALSPAGEAYCWGFNDQGQLGTRAAPDRCTAGPIAGAYPCARAPQRVDGGLSFRAVANGFEHTCALDAGGRAYCWGANDRGQLGTPAARDDCVAAVFGSRGPCSHTPLPVATSLRFVSIGAGYRTTCALSTDQRVFCWGNDEQGSVGMGRAFATTSATIPVPTEVAGGLRYRALSVGYLHACAVPLTGATRCWGYNGAGQLGDGGWQPQYVPTPLADGSRFAVVAAGKLHTCAFTPGDGAYCWGEVVGVRPTGRFASNWESAPLPTVDRTPMDTLVSGATFSCALYGGWARCWGTNDDWGLGGPLPGRYPDTIRSATPVDVPVRATFETIAAGFSHACGVRTGGAVYCWGDGIEGELGDGRPHDWGTDAYRSRPVRVALPF